MAIAMESGDTLLDEQIVYTRGCLTLAYLDPLLQVHQQVQRHLRLRLLQQVHQIERPRRRQLFGRRLDSGQRGLLREVVGRHEVAQPEQVVLGDWPVEVDEGGEEGVGGERRGDGQLLVGVRFGGEDVVDREVEQALGSLDLAPRVSGIDGDIASRFVASFPSAQLDELAEVGLRRIESEFTNGNWSRTATYPQRLVVEVVLRLEIKGRHVFSLFQDRLLLVKRADGGREVCGVELHCRLVAFAFNHDEFLSQLLPNVFLPLFEVLGDGAVFVRTHSQFVRSGRAVFLEQPIGFLADLGKILVAGIAQSKDGELVAL